MILVLKVYMESAMLGFPPLYTDFHYLILILTLINFKHEFFCTVLFSLLILSSLPFCTDVPGSQERHHERTHQRAPIRILEGWKRPLQQPVRSGIPYQRQRVFPLTRTPAESEWFNFYFFVCYCLTTTLMYISCSYFHCIFF